MAMTEPVVTSIVDLDQVKDYLNIPLSDSSRDFKLLFFISALTPVVEAITGPILVQQYDEIYDGGQHFIRVRHRPIVTLIAISEYRGPIEYPQQIVASPDQGQIYSVEADGSRIVRRSAGGGIIAFPALPQSIHVVYTAGFQYPPMNVQMGMLELIRVNFQRTQQGKRRGASVNQQTEDELNSGPPMGFFTPNSVRELLLPNKKHASVA